MFVSKSAVDAALCRRTPKYADCKWQTLSKQAVDEWGEAGAGEEHQQADQDEHDQDGQEPPFSVGFEKIPEITEKTAGVLGGGFFEDAGFVGFFHGARRG